MNEDQVAIERYRYLLRTAPAETIERVHSEAFEKLTPQQRSMVFRDLAEAAPAGEQPRSDDPHALARAATRSELRAPGTLESALSGSPAPEAAAPGVATPVTEPGAATGVPPAAGTAPGTAAASGATPANPAGAGAATPPVAEQGAPAQSGPSFGAMVGGSLLGTVAGYVAGNAITNAFNGNEHKHDEAHATENDSDNKDGWFHWSDLF